jgi:hypothetical protein
MQPLLASGGGAGGAAYDHSAMLETVKPVASPVHRPCNNPASSIHPSSGGGRQAGRQQQQQQQ